MKELTEYQRRLANMIPKPPPDLEIGEPWEVEIRIRETEDRERVWVKVWPRTDDEPSEWVEL